MYGGTILWTWYSVPWYGLSPRVRGNQRLVGKRNPKSRSIPACTGEPTRCMERESLCGVYPRVYGGTTSQTKSSPQTWGLSPRVRGNHPTSSLAAAGPRSIPACTGEPRDVPQHAVTSQVHPRVYGGTYIIASDGHRRYGLSPRVRGNRCRR